MTEFGAELSRILRDRHLSQTRASYEAGFDHSYLSRVISGARRPTRELVEQIASALDLDEPTTLRLAILGLLPDQCQAPLLALVEQADAAREAITFRSSVLAVITNTERGVA